MARIEDVRQRQAVDTSTVTGVSKEADRNLALAPVKAPRSSSVKKVGGTDAAMLQLFKHGGDVLREVGEQANKKNYVNGEMMYMQGKTLADLEQAGASGNTIAGFKSMQATAQAHKWYASELDELDTHGKTMSPDEYRNKLNATFSGLLTGDSQTDIIITSLSKDRMTKLVAAHIGAHEGWKEDQTYRSYTDMLVARAQSGEDVSAALDLSDDNDLINGLPEARRRDAIVDAVKLSLMEDNPSIYESIDNTLGGYSAAQKSAIKSAFAQYEQRSQGKFNAELESRTRDVRIQVEQGKLTYDEGVAIMEQYKEEYGQSDRFLHAAETMMESAATRWDSAQPTEFSPDERSDVRNLRLQIASGEVTFEQGMESARVLQEKYGRDDNWLRSVTTRLEGAADNYWSYQQGQLRAGANKAQRQQEFMRNVENKLDANRIWELSRKGQRAAWEVFDHRLAVDVSTKVESGELTQEEANEYVVNKRLSLMSRAGVVDEGTAQQWTSMFSYNVLGDDGKVSQEAVAALEQYKKLDEMNPVMAQKYLLNQDARDTFEMASTLMEASVDPSNALAQAQTIMSQDVRQEDIQRVMTSPELDAQVDRAVQSAVDNFDPGVISNLTGTESMFYEVWDDEIERAVKSSSARADITRLTEAHLLRNPFLTPEVAVSEATKDYLAKSTFIMGTMVTSSGSTTVREDMGISANEPMVENAAMIAFLQDNGERMFGPDFGDWTFFDDRGFQEVYLFSPSTWLDWEAEPIGNMKRAIRDIPNMAIQYDSATKTFLVSPLSDDGVPGLLRKVPAGLVGAHYMQKRKDAVLSRNEANSPANYQIGMGGIR